jgi:ATP-dependent DNA helicase RecG
MTLYGDLDVSTLDEMPRNRGKIITGARDPAKLPDAVKFLREQLEAGRQAYIVYPLIDESPKLEAKAAATEFAKWTDLLAPMKCELLHGRIAADEKEAIMERFHRGETKALIATTVIEVASTCRTRTLCSSKMPSGLDSRSSTNCAGESDAAGTKATACFSVPTTIPMRWRNCAFWKKLRTASKSRKPNLRCADGDILGTAQSGLPPLKIGNLLTDHELMKLARNAAFLIFDRDPRLEMRITGGTARSSRRRRTRRNYRRLDCAATSARRRSLILHLRCSQKQCSPVAMARPS